MARVGPAVIVAPPAIRWVEAYPGAAATGTPDSARWMSVRMSAADW